MQKDMLSLVYLIPIAIAAATGCITGLVMSIKRCNRNKCQPIPDYWVRFRSVSRTVSSSNLT